MTRLVEKLTGVALRAPLPIILGGIALLVLGFLQTGRLRLVDTVASRQPSTSEAASVFADVQRFFPPAEYAMVVFEARTPAQEFQLKALAEVFAQALRDPRYVSDVIYRTDELFLTRYFPEGAAFGAPATPAEAAFLVNYLTPEDWRSMLDRLEPASIQRALASLKARVSGFGAAATSVDPLGLLTPVRERIFSSLTPASPSVRDGYFIADQGRLIALFLRPVSPSSDLSFSLDLVRFIEATRDSKAVEDLARDIRMYVVGPHARLAAELRLLTRDLTRVGSISAVLLLAALLFAYRRAYVFASLGLPFLCSLSVALGLAALFFGHLSLSTAIAVALVAVLTLAFAIHLHDRYIEEAPRRPDDLRGALRHAADATGRGNLLVTLILGAVFFQFFFAELVEVRRMAGLVLPGIVLAFAAAQLLMPAVTRRLAVPSRRRSISLHFSTLGMRHLAWGALAFPRAWLALVVMLTAFLTYHGVRIDFAGSARIRGSLPDDYIQSRDRVENYFGLPGTEVYLLVSGEDLEQTLQLNDAIYDELSAARGAYGISSIISLRNLLPSLASQVSSRTKMLNEINPTILERRLAEASAEAQLNYEAIFGPFLGMLETFRAYASEGAYVRWGEISPRFREVNNAIREFLTKKGHRYVALTLVFAPRDRWENGMPTALADQLRARFPTLRITSRERLALERSQAALRDTVRCVAILTLTIFLGLLFYLRRARVAFLAFAPFLVTGLWTLGALRLLAIPFGFASLAALPLLAAFTLVNVAQFFRRLLSAMGGDRSLADEKLLAVLYQAVEKLGRPAAIAGLLILVALGAPVMADHTGLQAFGLTMAIGLVASLVGTLALMPCLLLLLGPRHARWRHVAGFDQAQRLFELREERLATGKPSAAR